MDSSTQLSIVLASFAFCGGVFGLLLQFLLKSRCKELRCGPAYCIRDVLPADQAVLEIPENLVRQR